MLWPIMLLAAASAVQDVRPDPVCRTDVRWTTSTPQAAEISRSAPSQTLTVFSAIGQTACQPADLHLTAAYFDGNDDLICSGTLAIAEQQTLLQTTAIELHVMNLTQFARWRNGPQKTTSHFAPLVCTNADNTAAAQPVDLERAVSMRLYATVIARYGGLATADLRVLLRP